MAAGQLAKAFEVAGKGIEFSSRGGDRFFEPENHRMLAVILAKDPGASRKEVEAHFNSALQLAGNQKAKSLELRTAVSFARFADAQGDRNRARELVSPIFDSFTEGLDTPDLEDAKTLLEELS